MAPAVGIGPIKELTEPLPRFSTTRRASSALICYQQLLERLLAAEVCFSSEEMREQDENRH